MSTDIDRGLQINGKISRYTTAETTREQNEASGTCFSGLGMFDCTTTSEGDPFSYRLPYYNNMNSLAGEIYCSQCCGQDPTEIDTWDLYCPVDSKWESLLTSITYIGAEFRMGRRRTMTDMVYVTCAMM